MSLLPRPPSVVLLPYQALILSFHLVISLLLTCGDHSSVTGLSCYCDDFSPFVCSAKVDFIRNIHSFLTLLSFHRKVTHSDCQQAWLLPGSFVPIKILNLPECCQEHRRTGHHHSWICFIGCYFLPRLSLWSFSHTGSEKVL